MGISFKQGNQKPAGPVVAAGTLGQPSSKYVDHLVETPTIKAPGIKGYTQVEKINNLSKEMKVTDQEEEVMGAPPIPSDKLWHVTVQGARTVNLGNYESVKITVGITGPTTKDQVNDLYDYGMKWVSDKIEGEMAKIKKVGK